MGVIVNFLASSIYSACHTLMLLGILCYTDYCTVRIKLDSIPAQNFLMQRDGTLFLVISDGADQVQMWLWGRGKNGARNTILFPNEMSI